MFGNVSEGKGIRSRANVHIRMVVEQNIRGFGCSMTGGRTQCGGTSPIPSVNTRTYGCKISNAADSIQSCSCVQHKLSGADFVMKAMHQETHMIKPYSRIAKIIAPAKVQSHVRGTFGKRPSWLQTSLQKHPTRRIGTICDE